VGTLKYSSNRQLTVKFIFVCIACIIILSTVWHKAESAATPEELRANENKILAELVALKLQIETAQAQILSLEHQTKNNLRAKAVQEQELLQIKANLAASSKELGKWVEFTYRYGYVDVLDVLVSSSDFNDLINRSFLLWNIMDQQALALQYNRALRNQAEEKIGLIRAINHFIARDKSQLQNKITAMQRTETELAQFLSDLKNQSVELEARLNALSQQWAEVTGLTSGIINRLSTLPVEEFSPDGIKFSFGGMQLEYSDVTINRAVKIVSNDPANRINVNIKPELITISGRTGSQGVIFDVKGNFAITPDKKKIIFVPRSITVNNNTLEGYMLEIILDKSDLTWDITRYYPRLTITGFSNGHGKITFNLKY